MIGGQDLGGIMGLGPIEAEANEPVFHAEWERRAFALTLAAGALRQWNIDKSRYAREARSPGEYLSSSYYELWLKGLEVLLLQAGLASAEEIASGQALVAPKAVTALQAKNVEAMLSAGARSDRPGAGPARFEVGDSVRTKLRYVTGHTRLPRYTFGKQGRVEAVHGCHVLPDSAAAGRGEAPEWLYTICFSARELWGADADEKATVSIDAWDSYLEPA